MTKIKVGSAWVHKNTKNTIVIIAGNRTGHQYDRFWMFEGMTASGQIIEIEDYTLTSTYVLIEDNLNDSTII